MELFEKLGIDWRLLIAQLVNFAILFAALTFLLFKPLMAALEKRRKKIAESLENAERIGDELRRAGDQAGRIVAEARERALAIASESMKQVESAKAAALEKARQEVAAVVAGGRSQIKEERDAMVAEIRAAAAELVVGATEKIIGEKLSVSRDKHLIDKALGKEAA